MKRKLRVGMIGCGRIAGLLEEDPLRRGIVTHLAAYRQLPKEVEVISCAARHLDRARHFAEKFEIASSYDDYLKMLDREQLDIVSICAYSDSRYEMIQEIVNAGVRGIFCEKPVASSLREADAIIELCRRKRVHLSVNHTRRWGHDYQYVRSLIRSKKIGNILSAHAAFSGDLFHTGTHMFDILNFLFGPPLSVSGKVRARSKSKKRQTSRFEDYDGTAVIDFKKGIQVFVEGDAKDYFVFELDILGTKGRIRIGNHLFEIFKSEESKNYSGFRELIRQDLKPPHPKRSALELAVYELVRSLKSKKQLTSTASDARAALEVAFGIVASAKKGSKSVSFPLKKRGETVFAR